MAHATTDDGFKKAYPKDLPVGGQGQGARDSGTSKSRRLASFSLEGKVCVVTGAARGLGNMFARTFVESGCSKLAILDLKQEECDKAAKEISDWFVENGQAKPGEIETIGLACDVSDESAVKAAIDAIVEKFGKIDTIVANAGIVENYPATEYPTDRYKKLYDINVHGVFYTARETAKHMLRLGTQGSIILIASMSANIVNYPQAQMPYNASKAAVKHMANCLAVEWAKDGIRVNSLSPGYMLTALTRAVLADKQDLKTQWENMTPMGRMGNPEDLKGAIVYLASDASKFTTGSELVVDGGYSII